MDGFLLVSGPPIPAAPEQGKEHIKKSAYDYAAGRLGFRDSRDQTAAMYAGSFAIPYDALDIGLRLIVATVIGMALGLESMLRGKPTGMRTLGLVSFAAALVTLSLIHVPDIEGSSDGLSRVLQGAVQGILV